MHAVISSFKSRALLSSAAIPKQKHGEGTMHLPPRQLLRLLLQALAALCSRLALLCLWGPLRGRVSPSSAPEPGAVPQPVPLSVNYHFTRQCNYKCGFCFHTAKTSFVLPLQVAKRGLRLLKEAGK